MRIAGNNITDFFIDSENQIWTVGIGLNSYDGDSAWKFYDHTNSSLPNASPYYLDSRAICGNGDNLWVGFAGMDILLNELNIKSLLTGKSYTYVELGLPSNNFEVSLIRYNNFNNTIIVVCNELNTTEGESFLIIIDKNRKKTITRLVPYRINDIGIIGRNLKCELWICTENGIFLTSPGFINMDYTLSSGSNIFKFEKYYTASTSKLASNNILTIAFDERSNPWIGTSEGINYFDVNSNHWYVWNSTTNPEILGDYINSIFCIDHGHIFFNSYSALGGIAYGIYHFNGDIFNNINDNNSELLSNNINKIKSSNKRWVTSDYNQFHRDIWISDNNSITKLNYDIPYIKATSKYIGATGWRFVDISATGATGNLYKSDFPVINQYSWTYPSWTDINFEHLTNSFPGMNKDSLFLNVPFESQIDSSTLKKEYWENPEIPTYSQIKKEKLIGDPEYVFSITGPTYSESLNIKKIISKNDRDIVFGNFNSQSIWLSDTNGSSIQVDNTSQGVTGYVGSTGAYRNTAFISVWDKEGGLISHLTINSHESYINDVVEDGDDIYLAGHFKGYIILDKFIYSSTPNGGEVIGGTYGSIIGFSNSEIFSSSPYNYPWIYNSGDPSMTSGIFIKDKNIIDVSSNSAFMIRLNKDIGSSLDWSSSGTSLQNMNSDASIFLKDYQFIPAINEINLPDSSGTEWSQIIPDSITIDKTFDGGIFMGLSFSGGICMSSGENAIKETEAGKNWKIEEYPIYVNNTCYIKYNDQFIINWNNLFLDYPISKNIYAKCDKNSSNYNIGVLFDFSIVYYKTMETFGQGQNNLLIFRFDSEGNKIWGDTIGNSTYDPIFKMTETDLGGILVNFNSSGNFKIFENTINTGSNGDFCLLNINPNKDISLNIHQNVYNDSILTDNSVINDNIFVPGYYNGEYFLYKINNSGEIIDYTIKNSGYQIVTQTILSNNNSQGIGWTDYVERGFFFNRYNKYNFIPGKSMGNIDSILGRNPWKNFDLRTSSSIKKHGNYNLTGMEIPLMCRVFISSYGSLIPGQNNWIWELLDIKNNSIIKIKDSPYFSYLFDTEGEFNITLTVFDSNGNIIEKNSEGLIYVKDHRKHSAGIPDDSIINSIDYGYIPIKTENDIESLGNNLDERSLEILKNLLNEGQLAYYLVETNNIAIVTQQNQIITLN